MRRRNRKIRGRQRLGLKPKVARIRKGGKSLLPGFDGSSLYPNRRLLGRQARGFPMRAIADDKGDI